MKLKNTMIVTSDESYVDGFKPIDCSPLSPDKNGNIVVTDEELSEWVANKLHEITVNEADFRDWLVGEGLDEDLANRLILSAHNLLFS